MALHEAGFTDRCESIQSPQVCATASLQSGSELVVPDAVRVRLLVLDPSISLLRGSRVRGRRSAACFDVRSKGGVPARASDVRLPTRTSRVTRRDVKLGHPTVRFKERSGLLAVLT